MDGPSEPTRSKADRRPTGGALIVGGALLALAVATGCASGGAFDEPEEKGFDDIPELLLVEVEDADLELVPADTEQIRVTREETGAAGGDWDLEGGTLTLEADCGTLTDCEVRYEVALPADTALSVQASGGTTTVSDFTAPVEVSTGNGPVRVSSVRGPLTLTSGNGDLHVEEAGPESLMAATDNGTIDARFSEAPSEVEISTNNGDATVALPGGPYAVFETVGNGEIRSEIPVDDSGDSTVTARTDTGTIALVSTG